MNISFIRGPFLNPWELQSYLPLTAHHNFQVIGANWQIYPHSFPAFKGTIHTPHLWGSSTARIRPSLPILMNRLRSWTLGESFGLDQLEAETSGSQILHPAETFSTMTWQCLEIRRKRPCKVIATVWENIPHMGETHPVRRARKQRALRELDGFLAVTETSRRMLVEEGAPSDRIEVIPMAVDLNHFKPAPRDVAMTSTWNLKKDEQFVLFIGRWVEEKGIRDIIQAIPKVLEKATSPVRFCFMGAGPLESLLRDAEIAHPGHIQRVSFSPYQHLPAIHNMADIFILPSKPAPKWQEQFGYVLVESMACGKPIITTRSGSIPDVVGDAAVLVPPSDPSALASAIVQLLHSEKERIRLGHAAQERAHSQFDAQRTSSAIESFYERILRQPS